MSNCQIRFQNHQKEIVIKCQRNELMKNIISRYETESELRTSEFDFLYKGAKINMSLTLDKINNKDKEILIIVNPKKIEGNKDEMKKSNLFKIVQCKDQTSKIAEIGNFLGKKRKNNENFELFSGIENDSVSEIKLEIKIEEEDINQTIYFLDNTSEECEYYENGEQVKHNHDNLNELNESNTSLIIDGKKNLLKNHLFHAELEYI